LFYCRARQIILKNDFYVSSRIFFRKKKLLTGLSHFFFFPHEQISRRKFHRKSPSGIVSDEMLYKVSYSLRKSSDGIEIIFNCTWFHPTTVEIINPRMCLCWWRDIWFGVPRRVETCCCLNFNFNLQRKWTSRRNKKLAKYIFVARRAKFNNYYHESAFSTSNYQLRNYNQLLLIHFFYFCVLIHFLRAFSYNLMIQISRLSYNETVHE
jgi:hypothetical protein